MKHLHNKKAKTYRRYLTARAAVFAFCGLLALLTPFLGARAQDAGSTRTSIGL